MHKANRYNFINSFSSSVKFNCPTYLPLILRTTTISFHTQHFYSQRLSINMTYHFLSDCESRIWIMNYSKLHMFLK